MTKVRDKWLRLMLSVAAMLTVAACETGVSPSSIADLHGGWQLVAFELDDGTVIRPSGAGALAARFEEDDRLQINADCNVCSGSYAATASTLAIGSRLACTLAACPPGSLADSYLAALTSARSWELDDAELLVTYDEGRLRFVAQ